MEFLEREFAQESRDELLTAAQEVLPRACVLVTHALIPRVLLQHISKTVYLY